MLVFSPTAIPISGKPRYSHLLDGKFANRTGGSDFRINIEGGGINADLNPDLKVSKVAVNKVLKDNGVSVKLGETPVEKGNISALQAITQRDFKPVQ